MPARMTPSRAKLRSPSSWKRNCSKLCRCRGETKSLSLRPIESWKLSMVPGVPSIRLRKWNVPPRYSRPRTHSSSSPCTIFIKVLHQSSEQCGSNGLGRGRGEEVLDRVPQKMPVLAVARAVGRVRQDDELAVAIRQLRVEVQQVLVGRIAVPDAAQHQHRR